MELSVAENLKVLDAENGKLKNCWLSSCRMWGELLNEHLFGTLRHTRNLMTALRTDFNQCRPHSSLAGLA